MNKKVGVILLSVILLFSTFSKSTVFADSTIWSCSLMDYSCGGAFDQWGGYGATVPTASVGTVMQSAPSGLIAWNAAFNPAPLSSVSCVSADITKVNNDSNTYEGISLNDMQLPSADNGYAGNNILGYVIFAYNLNGTGTIGLTDYYNPTNPNINDFSQGTYYYGSSDTSLVNKTHNWKLCVSGTTYSGYIDGNLIISKDLLQYNHLNDSFGFELYTNDYIANYLITGAAVPNVAPVVGTVSTSANPVMVNNPTTLSANFTDANTSDTHTALWNWGDGTTSTGTVTESGGTGSVTDNHIYTTAGVYTVTLTVTDNAGASGTQTFQYVSVYNPTSQGLFSAASKFTSPTGAYTTNPSLTGSVQFGLSYKYQGSMPVGDKQFTLSFKAANLTFNATAVSSLVIANGMGTLTGTGTMNGGSQTYNFLVTGSETNNSIRVQITDVANNVIYDTQPGAPVTATPTTSVSGHVLAH